MGKFVESPQPIRCHLRYQIEMYEIILTDDALETYS